MINSQSAPTVGYIEGGGQVTGFYPTANIREIVNPDGTFKLVLQEQYVNSGNVNIVADAINRSRLTNPDIEDEFMDLGEDNLDEVTTFNNYKIAFPLSQSTILIKIPRQFNTRIVDYMNRVLGLTVTPNMIPKILINRAKGTCTVQGDVIVKSGFISIGGKTITISEAAAGRKEYAFPDERPRHYADVRGHLGSTVGRPELQRLFDVLGAMGATTQDLIDIVEQMSSQKMIVAELTVE